jgi:hypothetical protein
MSIHHHHHRGGSIDKELGIDECRPDTSHGDHWHVVDEGAFSPVDDYFEEYPDHSPPAVPPSDDHLIAEGIVDTF